MTCIIFQIPTDQTLCIQMDCASFQKKRKTAQKVAKRRPKSRRRQDSKHYKNDKKNDCTNNINYKPPAGAFTVVCNTGMEGPTPRKVTSPGGIVQRQGPPPTQASQDYLQCLWHPSPVTRVCAKYTTSRPPCTKIMEREQQRKSRSPRESPLGVRLAVHNPDLLRTVFFVSGPVFLLALGAAVSC